MEVKNELRERGLLAAVVFARGVAIRETGDDLKSAIADLVQQRKDQEFPAAVKDAVRNLLKTGGFKPSGRNKPASEYLAQAAREGRFPIINNLVDINNYVSLSCGLPISLLDANAVGSTLSLRYGKEGERYVFNSAGQEIDLSGLICACAGETDTPLGNPVKDSMTGKLKDTTTDVVGIIYSPNTADFTDTAKTHLEKFADLLRTVGGATDVQSSLD